MGKNDNQIESKTTTFEHRFVVVVAKVERGGMKDRGIFPSTARMVDSTGQGLCQATEGEIWWPIIPAKWLKDG